MESRMRAARIYEYGGPSVIKVEEASKPEIAKEQVLVEVHASSINPVDGAIRAGYMRERLPLSLPATLGGDFAGVITKVGEGVSHLKVGDTVYGQANALHDGSGAFAEFVMARADRTAIAPKNISMTEAATLPLVGTSAVQALLEHMKLESGQKLLILGGSGGIGTIAIQIAHHIGARVTATATGDGLDLVKKLGADEALDFTADPLRGRAREFDAIFNTANPDAFTEALPFLKPGGIGVTMTGQPDEALIKELGVTVVPQMTVTTTGALETLRGLVEEDAVIPQVEKTFPLEHVAEAFTEKENGDIKGKVAILIKE